MKKSFELFFADTKHDCVEPLLNVMEHLMTSSTLLWAENRLKDFKLHDKEIVTFLKNSAYDPAGIDFAKVKEEAGKVA